MNPNPLPRAFLFAAAVWFAPGVATPVASAELELDDFYESIEEDINEQTKLGNFRILLYRSYLPSSQPDRFASVPEPSLTTVEADGTTVTHPFCPVLEREPDSVDFRDALQHLASGDENVGGFFRKLAEGQNMQPTAVFPYCAWWMIVSTDNFNIIFPDQTATYWSTPLFATDEGQVILNGVYPDNRYMSMFLYNEGWNYYTFTAKDSGAEQQSWFTDYQIAPDRGNKNPWIEPVPEHDLPGGNWTITIRDLPDDWEPTPGKNELPWFGTRGAGSLAYGALAEGAVGRQNGTFPIPPPCGINGLVINSEVPCTPLGLFVAPPPFVQSGVVSNYDNTYIPALTNYFVPFLSRTNRDIFYVVRGKLPRTAQGKTPTVWNPENNPKFGEIDMRYFSVCNAVLIRPYPAVTNLFEPGNTVGCAWDDELRDKLDPNGVYTIVSASRSVQRKLGGKEAIENTPNSAGTVKGTNVIRALRLVQQLFLVRTMMPVNNFAHPGQRVPKDGAWASVTNVMRDYAPITTGPCSVKFWFRPNSIESEGGINGWENCVAPLGGVDPPPKPVCDPSTECTIDCETDADCPAGQVCMTQAQRDVCVAKKTL